MSDDEKVKHNVYSYKMKGGSISFFSEGVTREFGENRVIFVDGRQVLSSVQPLHDKNGLTLAGYLYA